MQDDVGVQGRLNGGGSQNTGSLVNREKVRKEKEREVGGMLGVHFRRRRRHLVSIRRHLLPELELDDSGYRSIPRPLFGPLQSVEFAEMEKTVWFSTSTLPVNAAKAV